MEWKGLYIMTTKNKITTITNEYEVRNKNGMAKM